MPESDTQPQTGTVLLGMARAAIAQEFGHKSAVFEEAPWLREVGATFVTLTHQGQLRGCIGTLDAHRPLRLDVQANARAAAFHDPRFPPLERHELEPTTVEVSLLSALKPLEFASEMHALSQLRPGTDGVLLEYLGRRGTFLPQVWEQLPEPHTFLAHLKQKAGLPGHFWSSDIRLMRYTVSKWREDPPAGVSETRPAAAKTT